MSFWDVPYIKKRILGRAKYSGRSDDNLESIKLRFDTFKDETLPTVEIFKGKNKCFEVDASQGRQEVYQMFKDSLAEYTDRKLAADPYTEKSEILLGLRPYPDS